MVEQSSVLAKPSESWRKV